MSQPNLLEDGLPDDESASVEAQPEAAQPTRTRAEVPTQKQKTNIYTVMLIISFVCIVIACVLLAWELSLWGSYPWWDVNQARPDLSQAVVPPKWLV